MGKIIGILVFIGIMVAVVLLVRYLSNRDATHVVRRKDLKAARRELAAAEKVITDIRGLALSNIDFQPHLAGVILTRVQEHDDLKQKELT